MAPLGRACLLPLLRGAAGLPAREVLAEDPVATNGNRGTSFISVARLGPGRAVQCFVDWGSGVGAGTCNILSLETVDLAVLSTHVFSDSTTINVQVESFSSSVAVVCYSDVGSTMDVLCKTLTIDGDTIQDSQPYAINAQALSAYDVSSLSVTSFSESEGVACWSSTNTGYQDHAGVCNKLALSGSNITVGDEFHFDLSNSVTDISVEAFSDSAAVLCFRSQGVGACRHLAQGGSQGADFELGDPQDFLETSVAFDSVVAVSFGSGSGAVCYAGGVGHDYLGCKGISVAGSSLSLGSDEQVVSDSPANWATATAIADGAALLCYAAAEEALVCNVIGVLDGTSLDAGPPNEVHGDATDDMSVAVASLGTDSAILCFSIDAGAGSCMALTMPPTTTSITSTASSATATATTETSSTTPHTTTATGTTASSTTASGTTATTATAVPAWEAAAGWSDCSSACGQGEQTRNVSCSAGDEALCEASSTDARPPESRQCWRYAECAYEWTCPLGPDPETGEGCGVQRALVLAALAAAAALGAAAAGLLCARRGGAPGGAGKVPAAPAAGGLPDDGSASGYAAFCARLEAMEEARARGGRREYPRQPEVPRGLDFTHPAGVVAGASLDSAALDQAEGRRVRAFPRPLGPASL